MSEQNVDLFATGSGGVFTFEDRDTAAGVFTTDVASDSIAWFVSDEGGAAPVYASVNAVDLSLMGPNIAGAGLELGYKVSFGEGGTFNVGAAQEFGDGASGPTFNAGISWLF